MVAAITVIPDAKPVVARYKWEPRSQLHCSQLALAFINKRFCMLAYFFIKVGDGRLKPVEVFPNLHYGSFIVWGAKLRTVIRRKADGLIRNPDTLPRKRVGSLPSFRLGLRKTSIFVRFSHGSKQSRFRP